MKPIYLSNQQAYNKLNFITYKLERLIEQLPELSDLEIQQKANDIGDDFKKSLELFHPIESNEPTPFKEATLGSVTFLAGYFFNLCVPFEGNPGVKISVNAAWIIALYTFLKRYIHVKNIELQNQQDEHIKELVASEIDDFYELYNPKEQKINNSTQDELCLKLSKLKYFLPN